MAFSFLRRLKKKNRCWDKCAHEEILSLFLGWFTHQWTMISCLYWVEPFSFPASTLMPNSHRTRDTTCDVTQANGTCCLNGSIHTARKQHQRKNIPICMRVARSVWIRPSGQRPTSQAGLRPFTGWLSQNSEQVILNSYLPNFRLCIFKLQNHLNIIWRCFMKNNLGIVSIVEFLRALGSQS